MTILESSHKKIDVLYLALDGLGVQMTPRCPAGQDTGPYSCQILLFLAKVPLTISFQKLNVLVPMWS